MIMGRTKRIEPGPGQESVWDYPRPPRLEDSPRRIRIEFGGETIVDTRRAKRVLETSHPPGYYVPIEDVLPGALRPSDRSSHCEFKGHAAYHDLTVGSRTEADVAWTYPRPTEGFGPLAGHVAFYPGRMERCRVDDEVIVAQPGDFYGGWVTSDIVGPFKGGPGSMGW